MLTRNKDIFALYSEDSEKTWSRSLRNFTCRERDSLVIEARRHCRICNLPLLEKVVDVVVAAIVVFRSLPNAVDGAAPLPKKECSRAVLLFLANLFELL